MKWVLRQLWEPISICEIVVCCMQLTYGYSILECSLWHCKPLLTLSCISISSANVVGEVACANWSFSGWMTALTLNMAILDLKSYTWCTMENCSHSTSRYSRKHVSLRFEYKGPQWIKYRESCTKVNIFHITVTYLTTTMTRKIRKREPETGTNGSIQNIPNPRVDEYGYRFGPRRSCECGFWTVLEPNWTNYVVQTRTRCKHYAMYKPSSHTSTQ